MRDLDEPRLLRDFAASTNVPPFLDGDGVPPITAARLMTPTGRSRVGRNASSPPAPKRGALIQIPSLLAIAPWLTGAIWFVGLPAYRFDLPPKFVASIFIVGSVAAVIEWVTIKLK